MENFSLKEGNFFDDYKISKISNTYLQCGEADIFTATTKSNSKVVIKKYHQSSTLKILPKDRGDQLIVSASLEDPQNYQPNNQQNNIRNDEQLISKILVPQQINLISIFEYCNGGCLFDYLYYTQMKKISIPQTLIRNIFIQIVQGLELLNKKQIMHRDIKPENIFLIFDGHPNVSKETLYNQYIHEVKIKIGDTSYSKQLSFQDVDTQSDLYSVLLGTEGYGIPYREDPPQDNPRQPKELKRWYNPKNFQVIDLLCLGKTLFMLAFGSKPFRNENGESSESFKYFEKLKIDRSKLLNEQDPITVELLYLIQGLLILNEGARMTLEEIKESDFYNKEIEEQYGLTDNDIKDRIVNDMFYLNTCQITNQRNPNDVIEHFFDNFQYFKQVYRYNRRAILTESKILMLCYRMMKYHSNFFFKKIESSEFTLTNDLYY
jgi:serine/threonine protein kinase